jgi:hypothetical protein
VILLYADDPGGCNYLSPLAKALAARAEVHAFWIAPSLQKYVTDRGIAAHVRPVGMSAQTLLSGVDLLIVGTSEDTMCFAHELVTEARLASVPSLGAVDMNVNADCRFRGETSDPLAFAPDWLAVSDALAAESLRRLGFPSERMLACGHPHFDEVRTRRVNLSSQERGTLRTQAFGLEPTDRPIWVFLAEGVDQLNPGESHRSEQYTLTGRGTSDFRAAIVLQEVLDAARDMQPRPWLVLRLHPKSKEADFASVAGELDLVSRQGDPLPLIYAADLVVGMSTMLLVEAYLLGCAHLSVLPRPSERQWLFTLESGMTHVVWTRESLRKALAQGANAWVPTRDDLPTGATDRLLSFIDEGEWRVKESGRRDAVAVAG